MKAPAKLAGYGLVLAVALGGGLAAGDLVGPADAEASEGTDHGGGGGGGEGTEAGHDMASEPAPEDEEPTGLSIAASGFRFVPEATELEVDRAGELAFRIVGDDGQALREYDETHERELHLIVVSRDLTWFDHVHPERDDGGTWRQSLTLPAAGPYRAYADFAPAGAENLVLGVDLSATGRYDPADLPPVDSSAEVDGYTVTLDGDLVAGEEAELGFTVERDGEPVTDLDPYLGAAGHLVALRAGDLAYLHVHPTSDDLGPEVRFAAHVPSTGTYRLFLDFSHGGVVRTAAFSVDVPERGSR